MLEMDDCLWTWRLNTPPAKIKNEPVSAERIGDHPLRFLTYEGPVQNNTGQVKITDKGTYTQYVIPSEAEEPVQTVPQSGSSDLKKTPLESLTFELHGNILNGKHTLSKTENALWTLQSVSPKQ